MLYILALILIFFALPVIGKLLMRLLAWYVSRKITSQARKAYGQAFGTDDPFGMNGANASRQRSEPDDTDRRRQRRRQGKRIDPSVGEYVDYEEIEAESTSAYTDSGSTERYATESQIVDAEWEDIR